MIFYPSRPKIYYVSGLFFLNIGEFDEAEKIIRRGLIVNKDDVGLKSVLASLWMRGRNFREGLVLFEERLNHVRHRLGGSRAVVWDGKPFQDGSLLITDEGGFGDTLQMMRYIPQIARLCPNIIVTCDKRLTGILSRLIGDATVQVNGSDWSDVRRVTSFLSLPFLMGTDLDNVPGDVPYVTADPVRSAAWRARLDMVRGYRVGVSWYTDTDPTRRFPLSSFDPIAAIPAVSLVSLQKGKALSEAAAVGWQRPLVIFPDMDEDGHAFMDTAAIIANLDLVITNDTSLGHLAGALGRPVWLCVGKSPDWRWGERGETTPWYPTMRIFRSKQLWRWEELFADAAERLKAQLSTWTA